jgi:hypothetical protein
MSMSLFNTAIHYNVYPDIPDDIKQLYRKFRYN